MSTSLQRIRYEDLNSRQKESYNFQKVSALLADYGFATIRLSDDWQGADFIAQHQDGVTFLKVQLKGRAAIYRKYEGRDLHICFPDGPDWYLYPHDEVVRLLLQSTGIGGTESWLTDGGYSWPGLSRQMRELLAPWRLSGV